MYMALQYTHVFAFGVLFFSSPRWRVTSVLLVGSAILYLFLQDSMDVWNSQAGITSYLVRAMIDSIVAFILSKYGGAVAQRQALILIFLALVHVSAALEYHTDSMVMYTLYPIFTNGLNILQILVAEDGFRDSWRNIKERVAPNIGSSVRGFRNDSQPVEQVQGEKKAKGRYK